MFICVWKIFLRKHFDFQIQSLETIQQSLETTHKNCLRSCGLIITSYCNVFNTVALICFCYIAEAVFV